MNANDRLAAQARALYEQRRPGNDTEADLRLQRHQEEHDARVRAGLAERKYGPATDHLMKAAGLGPYAPKTYGAAAPETEQQAISRRFAERAGLAPMSQDTRAAYGVREPRRQTDDARFQRELSRAEREMGLDDA